MDGCVRGMLKYATPRDEGIFFFSRWGMVVEKVHSSVCIFAICPSPKSSQTISIYRQPEQHYVNAESIEKGFLGDIAVKSKCEGG